MADNSILFLAARTYLRILGVGNDEACEIRGSGGALERARACVQERSVAAARIAD